MSDQPFDRWEERVHDTARTFRYPPTPDIASGVRRRLAAGATRGSSTKQRLIWAGVIVLIILAIVLGVPPVRAAVFQALRIGNVRIIYQPTPTVIREQLLSTPTSEQESIPAPSATPSMAAMRSPSPAVAMPSPIRTRTAPPTEAVVPTRTPSPAYTPLPTYTPTPTPGPVLASLPGRTTLERARKQVSFPIRLPAYPKNLGKPDRVYVLDKGGGQIVVLVWLEPGSSYHARYVLYEMGQTVFAVKFQPPVVRKTTVNGRPAAWARGPHLIRFFGGRNEYTDREVKSNVLIWQIGQITYRLETNGSLRQAKKIAESLR